MKKISERDSVILRAGVLALLERLVKAGREESKEDTTRHMAKGDTLAIRSPLDGTRIGRISKSDPKPRAVVTDRAALEAWITFHYPGRLVSRTEIKGPMADVLDVLREHAPHLVAEVTAVPDWAIAELLRNSEHAHQPMGFGGEIGEHAPPGVEVDHPAGVISVVLDKETARPAVEALWQAGMVGIDGHVRQIEGGRS